MSKMEELMEMMKASELFHKKEEKKECCKTIQWALAIIGAIAVAAVAIYAIYRHFKPDYLEDLEDEFEDDFEDEDEEDYFVDESDS